MNSAALPHPAGADRIPPGGRLRIRINLTPSATAAVAPPAAKAPARRKLKTFNFHGISIPYGDYGRGRKHYWMLFWYEGTQRVQECRSTFGALKARAEEIATKKHRGETAMLHFKQNDRASYLRGLELLQPTGKSLELAASEYAEMVKILADRIPPVSPLEAVKDFAARNPPGFVVKTIPELVAEFYERRTHQSKWRRNLKKMLDRFADHFKQPPLLLLKAGNVVDWLGGLKDKKGKKLGPRAQSNHRAAAVNLISFARERGYVPETWNIMKTVPDPEAPDVDVKIYTPDELLALLNTAERYTIGKKKKRQPYKDMVPFIAITAFAYVRHGEMNEEKVQALDWSNVRRKTGRIIIPSEVAKRTKRKKGDKRVVDMPANLIAWLEPYFQTSGRITERKNTSNALCRLRKIAAKELRTEAARAANSVHAARLERIASGLESPKKNALRKSCISYRKALTGNIDVVADQAGNSVRVIRDTYLHVDEEMKEQAERWFAIMPDRADVLPLFGWRASA